MYNIFTYLKPNQASQTSQQSSLMNVKFHTYQPLPSKKEPVDDDRPVPNKTF